MKPRRGRDADAADDDRGRRADRGHLARAQQIQHEPGRQRARGREQRVDEREHADVAGGEAAAAVEAEPAEPQQAGAEQHVDRVVGQQRLAAVVLARADDQRRRERGEARAHLDRDAAREVERALRLQPAAAEGPVREHGVDEHRPQRGEDRNGPKRIRSTTAPATSAVVMMQNVAWKAMNSRCGIVVPLARLEGRRRAGRRSRAADDAVACRRRRASSRRAASMIVATAIAATHIMNVFSVFFSRTRPA